MGSEPYKIEILEDILAKDASAPITIYHIGAQSAACVSRSHFASGVAPGARLTLST